MIPTAHAQPGSRRPLMVGLLILVTAVAFEAQAVSTAMPAAAADLGQVDLYAWAFTAFMIPQIVAIVMGGRLCDSVGPAVPLKAGIAVFAAGVVVSACAQTMPMLLAGRFVQGFGGGLVNLALMVVVGRAFPPKDTGRVMTYFSFAWMLPSFLGPATAAWIVKISSWHFVFWAVLPLVLIGIVLLGPALGHVPLPGLHEDAVEPAGLPAAFAVAIGVGLLQAAGQRIAWWSAPLAIAGAVLLVVWLRRLMPVGWTPLGPGLPSVILVRALVTGAFFGSAAFVPLMLVQMRHQDLLSAGYVLTVASVGWTAGSWLQSRRWLMMSRDSIVTLGAAAVAAGLVIVCVATLVPALPLWVIVVGAIASGAGMGLASSSTSILVIQLSESAQLGRNTSALQVGESIGNALVVGIAGTAFALFVGSLVPGDVDLTDEVWAFGVPSAFVAACALLSVALSRSMGHVENLSARPAAHAG